MNSAAGENNVKTLLLTDMPPCSNWTSGIVTAQMCRAFEPGALAVFAVMNPNLELVSFSDLAQVPTSIFGQPNEDYSVGNITTDEVFASETKIRTQDIPRLVKAAAEFGRMQGVGQVWAVLEGQTMVRLALAVAQELAVPLKSHIWDPLSWWQLARNLDPKTCAIDNALLEKTLTASEFVVAPSWVMAEKLKKDHGVPSYPIITSMDASVAQPAATGFRSDGELTIGIAGQFYASDAWISFYEALEACGWMVGGRKAFINVYGAASPTNIVDPSHVRMRGWYAQPKLVEVLSKECDICYCPYPFDVKLEEVSRFSFPSKAVVYLASGRPIFFHGPAYSSPSIYLLDKDASICCHSTSASDIISALEHLATNHSLYTGLATRGADAFRADFTLDTLGELVREHLWPSSQKKIGNAARSQSESYCRDPSSEQVLLEQMFDPYFYWNTYRQARNSDAGVLGHYLSNRKDHQFNPHPLFSVQSYLASRPDVAAAGVEPFAHYLKHGWREGSDPHPLFSGSFYCEKNPDVKAADIAPFTHYLKFGWREGRDPHPLFSVQRYLSPRPDLSEAGAEPLTHFVTVGWRQKIDPHPLFSIDAYLTSRPDIAASGMDPLSHYLCLGWKEGADPHPLFSVSRYLAQRSDVAEAGIEPLQHYMASGWKEGVDPHPLFSIREYLNARPDVSAACIEPLTHYLTDGWREGTDPHPLFSVRRYLSHRLDVVVSNSEPLAHYLSVGWRERTDPHALFSISKYLQARTDVAAAGVEPLCHYLEFGWREGARVSDWFSPEFYSESYPVIAESGVDLLTDYIARGWKSGRDPNAWFSTDFYVNNNPGIDFTRDSPLGHYVETGWRELRDPNTWFSIAEYHRHFGEEVKHSEPITNYLKHGDSIKREGDEITISAYFVRNYRNTVALRQAVRVNERLQAGAKRSNASHVIQERAGIDSDQRVLELVENILTDVGERVIVELEAGGLGKDVEYKIWTLLHDITRSADSWLRVSLAQK
ncbi:hypothetical protein LJR098_003615 [Rhizobium sp. LjRoot98]|uniref:hypothetical protein n=1 Tax=Rhizobium sp. LjRoot98 TaxID=3342345 RepID=UPI003ED09791